MACSLQCYLNRPILLLLLKVLEAVDKAVRLSFGTVPTGTAGKANVGDIRE